MGGPAPCTAATTRLWINFSRKKMIVRGLVRLPRLRLLAPSVVPAPGSRWNSCGDQKNYSSGDHGGKGGRGNQKPFWGSSAVALGLGAALFLHHSKERNVVAEESNTKTPVVLGERKEGLPEFTMEEVGKNSSREEGTDRVWVTFKDGVYDITDFIDLHPGSTKLLIAAEVWSKAVDSSFNVQPESFVNIWNLR